MNNEDAVEIRRATPGHRIAAAAVDVGLNIVTLNIGWFIWNLIVMANGQTPGKQLLKIRVLGENTKKPATWGHMAVRQFLIPFSSSLFFLAPYLFLASKQFNGVTTSNLVLIFICFVIYVVIWVIDLIWFFTKSHRRLIDYWAKTIVVNEA